MVIDMNFTALLAAHEHQLTMLRVYAGFTARRQAARNAMRAVIQRAAK